MYRVTDDFKRDIFSASRRFDVKLKVGEKTFTGKDVVSISMEGGIQPRETFDLGSTVSTMIKVELLTREPILETYAIEPEIGLWVTRHRGSIEYHEWEWVPMGTFYIDELEEPTRNSVSITAYDAMIKAEAPFDVESHYQTLRDVAERVTEITGIPFEDAIPAMPVTRLTGSYSVRGVLSFVASMLGGCMTVTRSGKFKIIKPTGQSVMKVDGHNYFTSQPEKTTFKIGKMTCILKSESGQDKEKTIESGVLEPGTREIQFENPWMAQPQLDSILGLYEGFYYNGYTLDLQGNPAFDAGDIIELTDIDNVKYNAPILWWTLTYNGGLSGTISAKGSTEVKNSFDSKGSVSKELDRVVARQGVFNQVITESIEAINGKFVKLEADIGKFGEIFVGKAEIDSLIAENATIKNLIAEIAKFGKLEAEFGSFKDLTAENFTSVNALIKDLTAGKADIAELNAIKATIGTLTADVAEITDLLAGHITSDNIQAGGITSDSLTIRDGFITNAMIDSMVANKITSGTIDTANVNISGTDGNMLIKDNTIQIKDGTRVRVQIGKDASSDYSMYVWDASGNLMFDASGLHEAGIKSGIIRDDMVAPNANISGDKIDIQSLVTEINGNETKIDSSIIQMDPNGQTLKVAFNQMKTSVETAEGLSEQANANAQDAKTSVDAVKSTVETHTTQINAVQGQIDTLIKNTTLEKDGTIVQMRDEYLKTVQTVTGIQTTMGNHQSSIDAVTGDITEVKSKQAQFDQTIKGFNVKLSDLEKNVNSELESVKSHTSTLEQSLDGFKTTVGHTYATKAELSGYATTASVNSAIEQSAQNIKLSVSETYATQVDVNNIGALVEGKARIFPKDVTPEPPYDVGDLWVYTNDALGEVLLQCAVKKTVGQVFDRSDWVLATNYLTDKKASGKYATITGMNSAIEQSASDIKLSVSQTYATKEEFNKDVKTFTTRPVPPYKVGDLWIDNTFEETKNIRRCVYSRQSGEDWNQTDWTSAVSYISSYEVELKLMPKQILLKVQESIVGQNDTLNAGSVTLTKDDFIIQGASLHVQNEAGKDVMYADLEGNIEMQGVMRQYVTMPELSNKYPISRVSYDKGGIIIEGSRMGQGDWREIASVAWDFKDRLLVSPAYGSQAARYDNSLVFNMKDSKSFSIRANLKSRTSYLKKEQTVTLLSVYPYVRTGNEGGLGYFPTIRIQGNVYVDGSIKCKSVETEPGYRYPYEVGTYIEESGYFEGLDGILE